jgi:S1-C subfamily serine protease
MEAVMNNFARSRRMRRTGIAAVLAVALVTGPVGVASAAEASTLKHPATHSAQAIGHPSGIDVRAVLAEVAPSVVRIESIQSIPGGLFTEPVAQKATGTGVIVRRDGLIVTNNHVVQGADKVTVFLADGRQLPATVLGTSLAHDLAVLQVQAAEPLPAVAMGDSREVRVGDPVVAIGNALALEGGPTVSQGIVSALNRTVDTDTGATLRHMIQTDAAINPGNSGGPLVDAAGNFIGINSAGAPEAENIGFAIPTSVAKPVVARLLAAAQR